MAELSSAGHPLPPDVTRGPLIVGVASATFALATISILLRFFIRLRRQAHGWDDYTIYTAWLLAILGEILIVLEVRHGMGRHLIYVVPELGSLAMVTTIAEINVALGTGFVKLSVCIFVLRVIKGTHHKVAITLYLVIAINSAITLVAVFCLGFQCRPLTKVWRPETPGKCFSPQILTNIVRVVGAFGCLTDFMCVLVPVFILRGLQMKKKVKYAMIGVISLGLITAACSIGKAVTSEFINDDPPWQDVDVTIWTSVEHMLGVFVACLPTLRPVLNVFTTSTWKQWLSLTYEKRSTGDSKPKSYGKFDRQERQSEEVENGLTDMIPLKPRIYIRSSTEVKHDISGDFSDVSGAIPKDWADKSRQGH